MSDITSYELTEELRKLSGWEPDAANKGKSEIGFSLGYLLRMIGESDRHDSEDFGMFETVGFFHTGSTKQPYLASCATEGEAIDDLYERADTPEDAAAKLCIELFKQGILKVEGKG